eukprot:SAG11_NODE_3491_length_2415_cov_2.138601_2_plen_96_part_00
MVRYALGANLKVSLNGHFLLLLLLLCFFSCAESCLKCHLALGLQEIWIDTEQKRKNVQTEYLAFVTGYGAAPRIDAALFTLMHRDVPSSVARRQE